MVILFLIVFFPMINFLWLSVAYGAGWYLNMIEAREVACRPPIESGGPTGNFVTPNYTVSQSQNWKGFMGVIEAAGSPLVAQYASTINPVLIGQSQVQTTVSIKPFMAMPFFEKVPWLSQIPGLGKPWSCVYYSTVVQEEQGQ